VGSDIPVFINTRDRVSPLRKLVSWLERAGTQRIVIVDNASTYPPLLDYLERSPHAVVRLKDNLGQTAPWRSNVIHYFVGTDEPYVETDPDVVPDENCPLDAIDHFAELLERYPEVDKVGFGLRIDDLSPRYKHAEAVRRWEQAFWRDEVEPGVFRAPIDTTFALYRPRRLLSMEPALRTGAPYLARHVPWYANSARPSREQRYYLDHAISGINNWDDERISDGVAQAVGLLGDVSHGVKSRLFRRDTRR
jgi:hypothetical protein